MPGHRTGNEETHARARERQPRLAIEVENDFAELRGTLRDLMQFQARLKVALFYSHDQPGHRPEVEQAVREVSTCFVSQGFMEAEDTQYLVILAPESCSREQTGAADSACSGLLVGGLASRLRFEWLEAEVWQTPKSRA